MSEQESELQSALLKKLVPIYPGWTKEQLDELLQCFITYSHLASGFMEAPELMQLYTERDLNGMRHGLEKLWEAMLATFDKP